MICHSLPDWYSVLKKRRKGGGGDMFLKFTPESCFYTTACETWWAGMMMVYFYNITGIRIYINKVEADIYVIRLMR